MFQLRGAVLFDLWAIFIDEAMLDVGVIRGGEDEVGSCVWANVSEHSKSPAFPTGVYQIFGHTQLRKNIRL